MSGKSENLTSVFLILFYKHGCKTNTEDLFFMGEKTIKNMKARKKEYSRDVWRPLPFYFLQLNDFYDCGLKE